MSFYDAMADTALQLIQNRGNSYPIRRESPVSDPVSGSVDPDPVISSGTIQAIILPASKGTVEAFDNRVATDSTRLRKLRFVLAAAKGFPFEPQNGDILEVNGEDWLILGATPLAPDGTTPLIYKMGVEKL